jgi:acetylornithine deacetylase/succinyl-diaminopimelate desuccinylase-like protein
VTAPILQAASRACQRVHRQEPVVELLSPGSGPMWSLGTFIGGVPVVCIGTGHANARVHSPNEHQLLKNYREGMRYFGVFLEEFGRG